MLLDPELTSVSRVETTILRAILWNVHRAFRRAYRLTEVAPRELTARSRLQITLELNRWFLFVELDHDEAAPRTMPRRM
jgi:hypothetical protein